MLIPYKCIYVCTKYISAGNPIHKNIRAPDGKYSWLVGEQEISLNNNMNQKYQRSKYVD